MCSLQPLLLGVRSICMCLSLTAEAVTAALTTPPVAFLSVCCCGHPVLTETAYVPRTLEVCQSSDCLIGPSPTHRELISVDADVPSVRVGCQAAKTDRLLHALGGFFLAAPKTRY
eukprot:GHUV01054675.1.p2 GENE.GHUV01054675.1~~GHUV01054675.1.p2  ORF type:complete len:115 (-),score=17.65 GHUV01054675.1:144-488(-)